MPLPPPWCLIDPRLYAGGSGAPGSGVCAFRQLPDDIPALLPLYTDFELNFSPLLYGDWAARNMGLALGISGVYVVLALFVGPALMAGRKAISSKSALAAWNIALALFSFIGFMRTAPHLLFYAVRDGFYTSICAPAETSFGMGACGVWTCLFIFSKVPELIDTVFLVCNKKPVIFLHWYHHATVLLYCWHSYATRSSAGLYFVAMNYGVHALMYAYYALTALGGKPAWGAIVTVLQISQMFVGMGVCAAVFIYTRVYGLSCGITFENYVAGLAMYASYAILFLLFACERYCGRGKAGEKGAKGGAATGSKKAVKGE